jgi:hypothetical protein
VFAAECTGLNSETFPKEIILTKPAGMSPSGFSPSVPDATMRMGKSFEDYFRGNLDWELYLPLIKLNDSMYHIPGLENVYAPEQLTLMRQALVGHQVAGFFITFAVNPEYSTQQSVTPFSGVVKNVEFISRFRSSYALTIVGEDGQIFGIDWLQLKILYRTIKQSAYTPE